MHGKDAGGCPDCKLARIRVRGERRIAATKATTPPVDLVEKLETLPVRAPDPAPAPDRAVVAAPASAGAVLDVVEARDAAILACIDRRGGLAMVSELRHALPTEDPANADGTRDQAIKHALTRLRLKGLLARTGETWSRVGLAMREHPA